MADNVPTPNLPVAPIQYEQRFQDQFANVLRLFFTNLVNKINSPIFYASYFDTTTQTNPVADAVNLFTFNSVKCEYQISRGTPKSKIYINNTGIYNFQFSVQLDKTAGGSAAVFIWPRINGVNVSNLNSKVVIDSTNSELIVTKNFVLIVKNNDYFELAWQSSDTDVVAAASAAASNYSAISSVILTVTWVSNYEANQ